MKMSKGLYQKISIVMLVTLCASLFMGMEANEETTQYNGELQAKVTYKAPVVLPDTLSLPNDGTYVTVTVPPAVYENAKTDLGDVRILDAFGHQVPYMSYQRSVTQLENEVQIPLSVLEARREADRDLYDFETGSSKNEDVLIDGLDIWVDQTGDYLMNVKIWGSYDRQNFEEIIEGTIYRVEDYSNETILFPETKKYKIYRIEIIEPTQSLVSLSAQGKRRTQTWISDGNTPLGSLEIQTTFEQKEEGTQTILTVTNAKNLPLSALNLTTEDVYHREISIFLVSEGEKSQVYGGEIFRVFLDQNILVQPDIIFDPQHYRFDTIEIIIENKDDRPLKIETIRLSYLPDRLIFKAKPEESYSLTYGDSNLDRPEYDLAQVVDHLPTLAMVQGTLGTPEKMVEPLQASNKTGPNAKLLLNLAILLAGLVLGIVSLRAFKSNKGKS